jgi:hypothetical protein
MYRRPMANLTFNDEKQYCSLKIKKKVLTLSLQKRKKDRKIGNKTRVSTLTTFIKHSARNSG